MATGIPVLVALIGFDGSCAIVAFVCTCIVAAIALAKITKRWKTEFPDDADIAYLSRFVLAYTPIEGDKHRWTRQQIATVVHALIPLETGVINYTDDSHWVEDMGLD